MFRVFLILFLFTNSTYSLGLDFDKYPDLNSIETYLKEVKTSFPQISTLSSIGKSSQGRKIDYLTISTNFDAKNKESIFISGAHHGNEKPSALAALKLIDYLTNNFDDGNISALLDRFNIYIMPVANPDGYVATQRLNANGIDLNRDYSYPLRSQQQSFKLIEALLIKEFSDSKNIKGAIAIHSGMTGVLWPWAYSEKATKELEVFYTISQNAANSMGINLFKQSNLDYPTDGELIDYLYMTQKTLAVTFEISDAHMPEESTLKPILNRSLVGMLTYMFNILDHSQNVAISDNATTINAFSKNTH